MYVAGTFYGAISVAQACVEALSKFLCDKRRVAQAQSALGRWNKLCENKIISESARDAALDLLDASRNDFHHMNAGVEQDHSKLEALAERCVNHLYTIESEVFAVSFVEPGKLTPSRPEYWPPAGEGVSGVRLRQLY